MKVYGWHFVGSTMRDGSPIPKDGVWLPPLKNLELCTVGYHGSKTPFQALQYAPGNTLCYCEFKGEILYADDKLCASQRRIVARMDAKELLWYFARMQALSVVHLWDAPDVVLDYLATGDEALRDAAWASARASARDAAWASAWDAAWDAAWASAWASARDAAWASARDAAWASARDAAWASARDAAWAAFNELVYECFEGVMK